MSRLTNRDAEAPIQNILNAYGTCAVIILIIVLALWYPSGFGFLIVPDTAYDLSRVGVLENPLSL